MSKDYVIEIDHGNKSDVKNIIDTSLSRIFYSDSTNFTLSFLIDAVIF